MPHHQAEKFKIMIIFCYSSLAMSDTFLSAFFFFLLKTFADLKPGLNE